MVKCLYCGTELKTRKGVHKEYENGLNIVIKNTPINTCDHCMEEYLSADTMYKINRILDNIMENKDQSKDDIIFVDFDDYK